MNTLRTLLLIVVLGLLAACSNEPPNPNPRAAVPLQPAPVDLPRYMGRWYIVALIPYFAEKDMVGSYAQWTLRDDGKIDDQYFGRKKTFDSPLKHYRFTDTPVPGTGNGEWRVRVIWPITVTQLTVYVDPDYRYTLIGYPGKTLGWVFSRDPHMDDATYRSLLAHFDAMGYDTSRFRRVPQTPDEIGKPGFETIGQ